MSIRKALLEQDILRRSIRLGWLGWLTIVVTASFLLALGVLVWRTMNQGPSPLIGGGMTQGHTTAPVVNLVNSPQGAPGEPPKGWMVWKTQDAIGQEIWDAAPEIKAWVIRDYLNVLAWTDAHMFEPQYLEQNLDQYYTDKRLAEMRAILKWEQENNKAFAISTVKRLPLGTIVGTFSQDGKKATLLDYHAAGRGQLFELRTRKLTQGEFYPNTMHMIELRYDDSAQRWKIARERMDYDLDSSKVIWQEEWSRVQ